MNSETNNSSGRSSPATDRSEMNHGKLTHKIIGCAMQVHSVLRNGFQEVIYQRALGIEFRHHNITYVRENDKRIFYKDMAIGTRRVDFFVENKIVVEIKAIAALDNVQIAQALNYLEAFNVEVGLLLNFGAKSLEVKRLLNKKFK